MDMFFNQLPQVLENVYYYCTVIFDRVFVMNLGELLNPFRDYGVIGRILTWLTELVTPLSDLTLFEFVFGAGTTVFVAFAFTKFVLDIIF